MTVADNGRGPAGGGPDGFGVLGMIERAWSIGGILEAGPGDGGGFIVTAVLPVAGDQAVASSRAAT